MKQRLLAVVAIATAWFVLDIMIHGSFLAAEYAATAQLWRPMEDMNPLFSNGVALITAFLFVLIYCQLISGKSLQKALRLGVFVGLLFGMYGGIGSYAYMPITSTIAVGWAISNLIKFSVAGAITGYFVKTDR